jgi:two-component system, cell cycle response regulator DivK
MSHAVIIDDNAKNVEVLAMLLEMEGVGCTKVAHPKNLDAALQSTKNVDVVFLDLEMPGKNGYEVLESLRADSRFKSVPIVAYTVHVSEIHEARNLGFHSFLGKPLDADKFPGQLKRILDGKPVWELP